MKKQVTEDLSVTEQPTGELDDGVSTAGEVFVGELDVIVGLDAKLCRLALGIVHRHG